MHPSRHFAVGRTPSNSTCQGFQSSGGESGIRASEEAPHPHDGLVPAAQSLGQLDVRHGPHQPLLGRRPLSDAARPGVRPSFA